MWGRTDAGSLEERPDDVREHVRSHGVGASARAALWMAWSGAAHRQGLPLAHFRAQPEDLRDTSLT